MSDPTGFAFTETMGGYVSAGVKGYRDGQRRGRRAHETLKFTVTITMEDLTSFLDDPSHRAPMTGTVDSSELGFALPIEEGVFNLLERGEDGRLRMGYFLRFTGDDGQAYVLEGFKDVHNDRVIDFWYDTTALFTTLRPEAEPASPEHPRGILRIRIIDLARQALSMRNPNGQGLFGHVKGLIRFNWFFTVTLLREYARPPRRGDAPGPA